MANTAVALSGSTGAVLFNPAGLAGIKNSKVSMSPNSQQLQNQIANIQAFSF